MAASLKIDFVSDIACPWCAVGLFSLEKALERLQGEVSADLPRVDFFHWVMVDIPPVPSEIAEGEYSRGFTPRGKPGPQTLRGARHGVLVAERSIGAVVAEEEAVVRCVDDQGVVGETLGFEPVHEAADVVIDALDAGEVVLHVALVLP